LSAIGEDLPYRPCVGIMVFNPSGQIWVGPRIGGSGGPAGQQSWQMPQGGIDSDENPCAAAKRELFEETNIKSITICAQSRDWLRYDLPRVMIGKALKGRYRGQTQKWFLVRFDGEEDEIDVERPGGGKFKPEFSSWKWVGLSELSGLIVPFKRLVYDAVVVEFGPVIEAATGSSTPQRH